MAAIPELHTFAKNLVNMYSFGKKQYTNQAQQILDIIGLLSTFEFRNDFLQQTKSTQAFNNLCIDVQEILMILKPKYINTNELSLNTGINNMDQKIADELAYFFSLI